MTNLSKRLKAIVEFVEGEDSLVDVGCDHGLLSIYLFENHLVKKVIASDINQNALNSAIHNINKRNMRIETVLSDGIKNINLKGMNTLIISGMGTNTILHILEDETKLKGIKKLILQSNNDHALLRQKLNDKGYYLVDESYVLDKGKWYVTCKFIQSTLKNGKEEVTYGFLNNPLYNAFLIDSQEKIFKRIPYTSIKSKFKALKDLNKIKKAISKK